MMFVHFLLEFSSIQLKLLSYLGRQFKVPFYTAEFIRSSKKLNQEEVVRDPHDN